MIQCTGFKPQSDIEKNLILAFLADTGNFVFMSADIFSKFNGGIKNARASK